MQSVQTRRYTRTGISIVAAAVAAAIIIATLIASYESGSTPSRAATAPAVNGFERTAFLEANLLQVPYTAPDLTYAAVTFQELNTIQTPYSAPVKSYEESTFWEVNTMQIPYTAPARPFGTLDER